MGLEIAEQLGWRVPDVIVYPTGGGVGLIGIHKALAELRELGWLAGPAPRLVAAQSTGCAPIVRAFEAGARDGRAVAGRRGRSRSGSPSPAPLGDAADAGRAARRPAAPRSRSTTRTPWPTCGTSAPAAEGRAAVPGGRRRAARGPRCCRAGAGSPPADRVVVLNTGSPLVQPETLPSPAGLLSPRRRAALTAPGPRSIAVGHAVAVRDAIPVP